MSHPKTNAAGRPSWLDREAYPFAPHWLDLPDGRMHYLDEGSGDVLLFVHGNPSWSYEYRDLVGHFSRNHRCIAVDHLGFGLSDQPVDASYLPQWHATNLGSLIDALDLTNITLIVQDWGGPIAMAAALERPERIRAVIASNSWFFDVRDYAILRRFSRIMGSAVGQWLCRQFNLFPRWLMKMSFGDPARLTSAIHAQYVAPFPTRASRKGTWTFPKAIVGESDWLAQLWARRERVAGLPALLLWGLKDGAFAPLLPRWQEAFLHNRTVTFADVGHNVAEEAGDRLIAPIAAFLAREVL